MNLPFKEEKLSDNIFIREFYQNTDSGEFCWHRDGKTRRNSTDEIREYLFNEYDRICAEKR